MIIQRKISERIAEIEAEISGVKSLYNITQFELQVMKTLKNQQSGSEKQLKVLDSIEVKVFGKVKDKKTLEVKQYEHV